MKKMLPVFSLLLLAGPVAGYASPDPSVDQLIPAGSVISCIVAEGGPISSKTTAVGDPVLCTLNPVEKYGRGQFPYGSFLEGRFEEYKDPGHFVGKGWMYLKFDRMYVANRVYPISAKVVATPGYKVASDGRILGNGHAVKDTIEWLIPVLWPIDLINLPRRGPRPVIKPETRLTLELMDDLGIPGTEPVRQQTALIERQAPQPAAPQQVIYQNFNSAPPPQPAPQVVYQQQAPAPVVVQQQPQVVYVQPPPARVYVRPPVVYASPYGYGYRYYPPPGY